MIHIFAGLTLSVFAQGALATPLLNAWQKAMESKQTLRADFKQEQWVAATETTKSSTGRVEVRLPDQFRWEVLTPQPSLAITRESQIWVYTPAFSPEGQGQLLKRRAEGQQADLIRRVLSGRLVELKPTRVVEDAKGRRVKLSFGPPGPANVRELEVTLQAKEPVLQSVVLRFRSGNRSILKFSQVETGVALATNAFAWEPPANTQVLSE